MSLKNALETAKEILAQHSEEQLDETYVEAEEMKKKKGTKAGGEDTDVEVTADGEGAMSADGTKPKIAEPLETSELGKTTDEMPKKGKEEEEDMEAEEDMEDEMMGMEGEEMEDEEEEVPDAAV